MGGQRSFLILTVFVSACLNRSRKLLLCFTSQTREQRARIPKGRWRTGLWAWVFAFWETVTSFPSVQFSHHVMSDSATPWIVARQASLSFTNSRSLLRPMSIELVMPPSHLILCRPLLLQPSFFPSIRVFSRESVLHIKWSEYWRFSFSISPSSEHSGPISWRIDVTV